MDIYIPNMWADQCLVQSLVKQYPKSKRLPWPSIKQNIHTSDEKTIAPVNGNAANL